MPTPHASAGKARDRLSSVLLLAVPERVDEGLREHGAVQRCTAAAIGKATDPVEQARPVLTAVRDLIWYDPYAVSDDPRDYRASAVAVASRANCVPKAVLMTASCRAARIPARLGFAGVRNHLQSASLRQRTGRHKRCRLPGDSRILLAHHQRTAGQLRPAHHRPRTTSRQFSF